MRARADDEQGRPPDSRTWRAPLRIATYRRLVLGAAFNEACWSLGAVVLALLVYDRTGSELAVAAQLVSISLAAALVAPLLTARLDTVLPRRALALTHGLEVPTFIALAGLAASTSSDVLWLLAILALGLVDGALAATGRALSRAAVARTLRPLGLLRQGNAVLNTVFTVGFAIGPGLAGLFVSFASPVAALLVAATCFGLAAVVLGTAPGLGHPGGPEAEIGGVLGRVRDAARTVGRVPGLRALLVGHGAILLACMAVIPVEVVYAAEDLGGDSRTYGFLLSAWGAGTVVGGVVFARARRVAAPRLVGAAAVGIGLGYGGMAIAPTLVTAMLGAAVGGVGNGVYNIAVVQTVQERISHAAQNRVMALVESINESALGLGYIAGGVAGTLIGTRPVFGTAAVLVIVAGLVVAVPVVRSLGAPLEDGASAEDVGAPVPTFALGAAESTEPTLPR